MTKQDSKIVRVLNRLVDHYGHQNWWEDENRIADWIYTILIQQTTQLNAERALENLQGQMTVATLHAMELEVLQEFIRPAGFYKQKSQSIKELMAWFIGHGADFTKFCDYATEDLRKELLSLKGVGQETADAMLLYIFGRNVFICDQYALRLFRRLGLGDYKNYSEMRPAVQHLVADIPHQLCKEWHAVIDVHGKHFGKNKMMDETWLLK